MYRRSCADSRARKNSRWTASSETTNCSRFNNGMDMGSTPTGMGGKSPLPNPVGGTTLYQDLYSALEVVCLKPAVWRVAATAQFYHWNGRVASRKFTRRVQAADAAIPH
jgi:hypothetical protein